MADHSKIQWTQSTWNPVAGCRKVSAGCDHCYAIRDAHRLAGNPNAKIAATYAGLTMIQNGRPNWTGVFRELPDRLDQPLRWKRPRRIFVNSMSDLFGEGISSLFISRVFGVMARSPWHQFQVLTKRPDRMRDILSSPWFGQFGDTAAWPLPNVWLGTSVEDQKAADQRIPALLQTPAAVRFLSCEPLLSPLDLGLRRDYAWWDGLHWVILGGESGPGARPMKMEWAMSLVDQCENAGVPCFVKQWGSVLAAQNGLLDHKGADENEWLVQMPRQFPGGA